MARGLKAIPSTDRLYQLPLSEFIAGRNALAKEAGADAAAVRALQKPNVPAWAVNQLYWRKRPVYDELVRRAEDLRATHLATLRGQRADLRGAGKEHEAAVEAALRATLALLAAEGQPATDATKQAIATTLRGLPGDEPAGRLSRPLEPRGFEMLTGVASAGRVKAAVAPAVKPVPAKGKSDPPVRTDATTAAARAAAREKLAEAREALTIASRAVRIAEQAARREEFEAARAARDAEKAQGRATEAEAAVEAAQAALAEAERDASATRNAREQAQERAAAATADLQAAKDHEKQARAAVERASVA